MAKITIEKENFEAVNAFILNPLCKINQRIYVPQKDQSVEARVNAYVSKMTSAENKLIGAVTNYSLDRFVIIREGGEGRLTTDITPGYVYTNKKKAQGASRFFKVELDEHTWKRAIGDRSIEDRKSPYHISKCDLPECCADISEARDILSYCKKQGGLIAHERDILAPLLRSHGLRAKKFLEYPIGKVLSQLEIFV